MLEIVPVTFAVAKKFVADLHRHNKPPIGHKFSVALESDGKLAGVIMAGRPVARAYDNGRTLEVNRSCTDGTKNANSMLYGAAWRVAKGMGYKSLITYTQADECGASLRAAGFIRIRDIAPRASWAESSVKLKGIRDEVGNGGVARVLWAVGDISRFLCKPADNTNDAAQ